MGKYFRFKQTPMLAVILTGGLSGCFLKHQENSTNDGTSVRTENGICHYVNPGSELHLVVFCESDDELDIQVQKRETQIKKAELERVVAGQVRTLVRATDLESDFFKGATAEVWISAPVLTPGEAHLVLVLKSTNLGVAFFLPTDLRQWDLLSAPTLQLGSGGYPSQQTWKSGQVVLAGKRSIRNQDFKKVEAALTADAGTTPAGVARLKTVDFTGDSIVLTTEHFSEARLVKAVQDSEIGRRYQLKPIWIPALEPDGYKAKGYSFTLKN